jgi:hypothetical protein
MVVLFVRMDLANIVDSHGGFNYHDGVDFHGGFSWWIFLSG